jgi:hypothetical protein
MFNSVQESIYLIGVVSPFAAAAVVIAYPCSWLSHLLQNFALPCNLAGRSSCWRSCQLLWTTMMDMGAGCTATLQTGWQQSPAPARR